MQPLLQLTLEPAFWIGLAVGFGLPAISLLVYLTFLVSDPSAPARDGGPG